MPATRRLQPGPTAKALIDRVTADVAKAGPKPVPGDAVTTSASGLDPDISPENADRQVARVAAARDLPQRRGCERWSPRTPAGGCSG